MYLDGELRLDLAPDVARLAAVDALVLVAPQVGDHQRRLHPVAVLVVRRQQDVVVLSIKHHSLVWHFGEAFIKSLLETCEMNGGFSFLSP